MDGLLTMLKNLKTALFQTFSTWHRILSALTALYWPSTAFYWPSTTKYQPVPPSTDPVPSCINYYRPLLIQYHQVSTSIATYWPSAIIYQPVPPSTDPVTPSTNRNRLLLTQYQPILLGLGDYRLLHSLPWVLFWIYFIIMTPILNEPFKPSSFVCELLPDEMQGGKSEITFILRFEKETYSLETWWSS